MVVERFPKPIMKVRFLHLKPKISAGIERMS
jgi:hypothetical protein